jgi:hypothetical protein
MSNQVEIFLPKKKKREIFDKRQFIFVFCLLFLSRFINYYRPKNEMNENEFDL